VPSYWHALPAGDEDAPGNPRVGPADLRRFAARVLEAAGLERTDAAAAAECLVDADLRGVGGHGVFRLMQYTDSITAGEINRRPKVRVVKKAGATSVVDADGGYGYRPTLMAVDVALGLARRHGLGCVGVRNSHHFGMAAAYALRAAKARAVGFVTTNSLPQIAPPGGTEAVVGNNPYAVAVPRAGRRRPIVVDIALTEARFGTAGLAALAGAPVPVGLALDRAGKPTTDAKAALESGILVAIGRQKGYGLSVAAEVLAGALTGSPVARDSHCHRLAKGGVGHFVLTIEPEFFLAPRAFYAAVETLCAHIKMTPATEPGGEVYLPGELGWRTYEQRTRDGIPLPRALFDELGALAGRLRVRALSAA
jgi:LDH2 family malate/lactate/ureidoglycolate dehydrogenase